MKYKAQVALTLALLLASLICLGSNIIATGIRVRRVNRWIEVPCTINSVRLDTGYEEAPDEWHIAYSYTYEDRQYTSDMYNIVELYRVKRVEDVEQTPNTFGGRRLNPPYAEGDQAICFVDPDDPSKAVLDRTSTLLKLLLPNRLAGMCYLLLVSSIVWLYHIR